MLLISLVGADEDAPVTLDASQTPRIELRGPSSTKVVGVMIAGIPLKTPRGSGLPDKYLTSKFKPFENEVGPCEKESNQRLDFLPHYFASFVLFFLVRAD